MSNKFTLSNKSYSLLNTCMQVYAMSLYCLPVYASVCIVTACGDVMRKNDIDLN